MLTITPWLMTSKKTVTKPKVVDKFDIIPEEDYVHQETPHKTSDYMTLFEFTAIVTAYASQLLTPGYTPGIDPAKYNYNVIEMAKAALRERKVRLVVRRELPSGETEDYFAWEMKLPPL